MVQLAVTCGFLAQVRENKGMLKQLEVGEVAASVAVVAASKGGSSSIMGLPNAFFQS